MLYENKDNFISFTSFYSDPYDFVFVYYFSLLGKLSGFNSRQKWWEKNESVGYSLNCTKFYTFQRYLSYLISDKLFVPCFMSLDMF